jgi:hypothetical protein
MEPKKWLGTGFGLITESTECLLLVTTSNCNSVTNLHNLDVTTAAINCYSFTIPCSEVASHNGDSPLLFWSSLAGTWPLTTDSSPEQSSNLLLIFTSAVNFGFKPCWDPWPYFVLSKTIYVSKWDHLFEEKGLSFCDYSEESNNLLLAFARAWASLLCGSAPTGPNTELQHSKDTKQFPPVSLLCAYSLPRERVYGAIGRLFWLHYSSFRFHVTLH